MHRVTFKITRKRLVKQMTLMWIIPMTIFFWTLMWHYNALSALTVVGVPLLALPSGFGFATTMAKVMDSYGDFKDGA